MMEVKQHSSVSLPLEGMGKSKGWHRKGSHRSDGTIGQGALNRVIGRVGVEGEGRMHLQCHRPRFLMDPTLRTTPQSSDCESFSPL